MSMNKTTCLTAFVRCAKRKDRKAFEYADYSEPLFRVTSECSSVDFDKHDIYLPNKRLEGSFRFDGDGDGYAVQLPDNHASIVVSHFICQFDKDLELLWEHYGKENVEVCYGLVSYWS